MKTVDLQKQVQTFETHRIVPVFYHDDEQVCLNITDSLYAGGIRILEFTNRGKQAFSHFRAIKQYALQNCPDLKVGMGTIFSLEEGKKFVDAGADFIVSPALVPEMRQLQTEHHTVWIPGCATISELHHAKTCGALLMKIFPAQLLGPSFVRAALSVMPDLKLMPTGGVLPTEESLTSWFKTGIMCAGLGSQFITTEVIQQGDWKKLTLQTQGLLQIVRNLKNR